MNYKEAYAWGVELLEKACVEESKIDAWYLLEYVTKISRAVFYAYPEKELTEEEKIQYEECTYKGGQRGFRSNILPGYRNLWDFRFW